MNGIAEGEDSAGIWEEEDEDGRRVWALWINGIREYASLYLSDAVEEFRRSSVEGYEVPLRLMSRNADSAGGSL